MKLIKNVAAFLLVSMGCVYAQTMLRPGPSCWQHPSLQESYHALMPVTLKPLDRRLEQISRQFLGRPYELFVLGEGQQGDLDQCPLYRLDKFDCETFVTSMLALTLSHSLTGYQRCVRFLRYQQSQVSFLNRHHFTSIDWNLNVQKTGLLTDVTQKIYDSKHHPIFKWSDTWVEPAGWYARLSKNRVRLRDPTDSKSESAWLAIKAAGKTKPAVRSRLPYLPMTALFDEQGLPRYYIFQQIPNGAVIEIVRPNWQLKDKIGTNLDISHLGFAFYHDGTLWFRHASDLKHQVTEEPLVDYLAKFRSSPTVGGINVQAWSAASVNDCES